MLRLGNMAAQVGTSLRNFDFCNDRIATGPQRLEIQGANFFSEAPLRPSCRWRDGGGPPPGGRVVAPRRQGGGHPRAALLSLGFWPLRQRPSRPMRPTTDHVSPQLACQGLVDLVD
jgi:hypothetical protein